MFCGTITNGETSDRKQLPITPTGNVLCITAVFQRKICDLPDIYKFITVLFSGSDDKGGNINN